eukprot:Amastigsp_a847569_3.p4 type:complete len:114 gc:universal Amastigsp_a847569_3:1031-690(-)
MSVRPRSARMSRMQRVMSLSTWVRLGGREILLRISFVSGPENTTTAQMDLVPRRIDPRSRSSSCETENGSSNPDTLVIVPVNSCRSGTGIDVSTVPENPAKYSSSESASFEAS